MNVLKWNFVVFPKTLHVSYFYFMPISFFLRHRSKIVPPQLTAAALKLSLCVKQLNTFERYVIEFRCILYSG